MKGVSLAVWPAFGPILPRVDQPTDPPWLARLRSAVDKHGQLTGIAAGADMPVQQLKKIVDGTNKNPGIKTLGRIAKAMGIPLAVFVDESPRPEGESGRVQASVDREGGSPRVEDHLGALLDHVKTLEGEARSAFIRAAVALFDALEHTRPRAGSGPSQDDDRR